MVQEQRRSMLQSLLHNGVSRETTEKESAKWYPNLIQQLLKEEETSRRLQIPPVAESRNIWNFDTASVVEYGERNLEGRS